MKPVDLDRWPQIRAHFDALVDLDPRTRSQRLAEIRDPQLRDAVESLLTTDSIAEERLERLDFGAADLLAQTDNSTFWPADPLHISGRTISHFRVFEAIASGGMGVVYRAEDTRLNRPVALKFPLPYHALDKAVRERFELEARSAGMLDHPNLCSVYEAGENESGQWFLAMPFYEGETLKAKLAASSPFPVDEALEISRQIAEGLACAHTGGIVHRDLKPANVMLLSDGTVKILDFGLAKVLDLSRTRSQSALGTPAYMAPEQIRGADMDGRADLWALGVVLYEMLVGEQPFSGENDVSIAHAILHGAPRPPSRLRKNISRRLETLVLGLLQKDPAQRYPSAQALAADIANIQRGAKPIFSVKGRRQVRSWLRDRSRGAKTFAIAMAVVVVASILLSAWLLPRVLERKPTRNAEAYDLYRRAFQYQTSSWTGNIWSAESLRAAETLYRRALALDPSFALARAKLADVLATYEYRAGQHNPEALEQVRREAELALKYKPKLGEAHLALAFYWDMRGDYRRSLAEALLAQRYSPLNAEIPTMVASAQVYLGQWDEAVASYRRATKLDESRNVQLAVLYVRLRRYEEAIRAYDRYLALAPDDYNSMIGRGYAYLRWRGSIDTLSAVSRRMPKEFDVRGSKTMALVTMALRERRTGEALAALAQSNHTFFGFDGPLSLVRGRIYSYAGDSVRAASEYETARAILADSVAANPDYPEMRIAFAQALAGTGHRQEGIRQIEAGLAIVRNEPYRRGPRVMVRAAAVFAQLHQNDRAIDLLKRVMENPVGGTFASGPLLRGDPAWDALRDDRRFQRLITDTTPGAPLHQPQR